MPDRKQAFRSRTRSDHGAMGSRDAKFARDEAATLLPLLTIPESIAIDGRNA